MKSFRNVVAAMTVVIFSLGALDAAFGQPAPGAAPAQAPVPNPPVPVAAQPQPPAAPPQAIVPLPQAVNGPIVGFGGGGRGGAVFVQGGGGFGGGAVGQGFVVNNGQLTIIGGPVDIQTQQTINALAARLRQLKSNEKPTDDEQKQIADLTDQLRQSLDSEFKQTQKSQFDEMAQLRDRLDKLQKEIADRNKNRESLLDQRLSDLLSGNAGAVPAQPILLLQQALQQPVLQPKLPPPQAPGAAPAPAFPPAPAPAVPANPEAAIAPPKSATK